jgi:hypothetical protein
MGEEFCRGCKDCTNNNPEEDFSHQANPPLTNINNPFFLIIKQIIQPMN